MRVSFLKGFPVRSYVLPVLLATPSVLQAQANSHPDLLADWQRNRSAGLAYIDAMPDSAAGFRPTPGVRTFAQQFDHIVTTNLEVAAVAFRGQKTAPALGDSTVYLHNKVALRRYAEATYDYFLKAFQEAKPAQLTRPVSIFGQKPQPAIRLAAVSFEHAAWTLGQVVPYLRLNGVTPPEYQMPF